MSMTNSLATTILNTYYVTPAVYISLHTADPTVTGNTATELAGGSYIRQRIFFGAPSSRSIANNAQVIWTNLPSATVTHFGILTAVTGGTFLHTIQAGAGIAIGTGGTLVVPVSDIAITLS